MQDLVKIYTDGGARGNPGPAACAFVVIVKGKIIHKESLFLGKTTNNVAEYSGVLRAYEWLLDNKSLLDNKKIFVEKIIFFLDSELVARQLSGAYKIKSEHLRPLASKIKRLELKIEKRIIYKSINRKKNSLSDKLVNKKIDENLH